MSSTGFTINLKEFTLEKLKDLLKTVRLPPNQQILREHIDERFTRLLVESEYDTFCAPGHPSLSCSLEPLVRTTR